MLNKSTIKFISILAGNWWNISNLMSSFWMLVARSSKQSLRKNQSNLFDRMTIASTCNQDLCQNSMLPNTIASEPMHGWTVSSSAASQTERQTHLSALSKLCGRGNGQVHARTKLCVQPQWQATTDPGLVVYTRARKSSGKKFLHPSYWWSLGLSWNADRLFCQLCQQVAKDQTRS